MITCSHGQTRWAIELDQRAVDVGNFTRKLLFSPWKINETCWSICELVRGYGTTSNGMLPIPDGFQLRPRHQSRCWVLVVLHLYCNLQRPSSGTQLEMCCARFWAGDSWRWSLLPNGQPKNFRVWHMICYTSSLEANQPLSRTYFCTNWYDIFTDIDKNIACVVAPVYIDRDCTYIWHFKV